MSQFPESNIQGPLGDSSTRHRRLRPNSPRNHSHHNHSNRNSRGYRGGPSRPIKPQPGVGDDGPSWTPPMRAPVSPSSPYSWQARYDPTKPGGWDYVLSGTTQPSQQPTRLLKPGDLKSLPALSQEEVVGWEERLRSLWKPMANNPSDSMEYISAKKQVSEFSRLVFERIDHLQGIMQPPTRRGQQGQQTPQARQARQLFSKASDHVAINFSTISKDRTGTAEEQTAALFKESGHLISARGPEKRDPFQSWGNRRMP